MMVAFDWYTFGCSLAIASLLTVAIMPLYAGLWHKHNRSLTDQDLHESKAENALLQYERGEMVRKLEEMDGRLRQSENENRLLRRRIVVLEDLVAVRDAQLKMERLGKDPVIGKCEEALEKLKGSAA